MTPTADGPTWSDIASWYDDLVTAGSGPHETAVRCVLDLIPDLGAASVLDIACGQGLATRAIADAGAGRVIGTDRSEEMLEIARRHQSTDATEITYVLDDAQRLDEFDDAAFDGVTCQLGLMDIPDLDATLSAVHRVLEPNGWLVFVIGHPCFLAPGATVVDGPNGRPAAAISDYFTERFWRSANPNGVRRAGNHHRTMSTYFNALVRAGLTIEAVDEPRPSPLLAEQNPLYLEVPIFLAVRARKRPAS